MWSPMDDTARKELALNLHHEVELGEFCISAWTCGVEPTFDLFIWRQTCDRSTRWQLSSPVSPHRPSQPPKSYD